MKMRVFACSRRDEAGKFHGVINAFPDIWDGKILDVGCRSGGLKRALHQYNPKIEYIGLDLHPAADTIADLEKGLPFQRVFEVVVALDVLEHTDDIHKAFEELCWVARRFIVITLPNSYELKGRMTYLLGRSLSGKYGLPVERPSDRHRWLFSFNDARTFVAHVADRCDFSIVDEGCVIGPGRTAYGVGRHMVSRFPNLLSPWYIVLLQRNTAVRS